MTNAQPAVGFYQLTRDPVEVAVPRLLERVLREGHKILVCTGSAEQVDKLDTVLWTYDKESFLPHGTDRNDAQDLQPVLLTANIALASAAPNNATVLLLLDNMLPEIHAGYQRCLYMFDGGLDGQVQAARRHWKEIKDKGLPLTYWQQTDTGGWTKTTQA